MLMSDLYIEMAVLVHCIKGILYVVVVPVSQDRTSECAASIHYHYELLFLLQHLGNHIVLLKLLPLDFVTHEGRDIQTVL